MKKRSKWFILGALICITALFIVQGCGKSSSEPEDTTDEWTVLIYGDGNNDIDYSQNGNSFCIQSIQNAEKVGSSDDVNVVAMVASLKTGGIAKYYYVEHYPNDLGDNISSTELMDLGTKDMSHPHTLRDFLIYGMENYPAKKYMVVIYDHGAGWPGACSDDQNGSGNMMTMIDMDNAFTAALNDQGVDKFDIIAYHCCLMSMVEVGYQLRSCADYLVASEFSLFMEEVFGTEEWLQYMVNNPSTSGQAMASKVVDAAYNMAVQKQLYVHLAATDLSEMDRLASKLDNLGTYISTAPATNYWDEVLTAWFNTWNTELDDPAYVDIRDFANNIKNQPNLQNINVVVNAADSVLSCINDAVIMTKTNAPGVTRGGLTIHMPKLYEHYDSSSYAHLDFQDVGWTNFLSLYIQAIAYLLGGDYSLNVTCNPANGGQVAVSPNQQSYAEGDTVGIQAQAASGYVFSHWSIMGSDYTDNPFFFLFPGQDLDVVANFNEDGGGGQTVTINGTISWPGHTLTHPYAFLDTSHNEYIYGILFTPANTNGTYTIQFDLSGNLEAYIEAYDDVNNNGQWDSGEPLGYYDANQNGSWDDMLTIQPGQTINNANISLFETLYSEKEALHEETIIHSLR